MSAIFWASSQALIAASQLGSERGLPPADSLRVELLGTLHQMVLQCRAAGIPDTDIAEARYAIVAFMDERILKSNWPGRADWMKSPLQLQLYREYAAGENFFARMGALLERPGGSPAVEVYYLCLALGFTGVSGTGGTARSYVESARTQLPTVGALTPISPHAIPRDRGAPAAPRKPIVLSLLLGCVVVAGMGLGILGWSTERTVQRSEQGLPAQHLPEATPVGR